MTSSDFLAGGVKPRLLAPGPVAVPPQVLAALSRPVLHHRSDAFGELFLRVRARLAEAAAVPGDDVLILAGSGTAAFEAGLLAAVPPGAKVIGVEAGKFGQRWLELARNYRFQVHELSFAWGEAADPEALAALLRRHPDTAAVTLVHSETSTGVLHDVAALAQVVHDTVPDALVLVDCVTSLTVTELRPRAWGLDGVFAGSQKGLMLPPGLGFAWLSERAWDRQPASTSSFYLDLRRERPRQRDGQTAYTPAVNLIYGLEVALELLLADGLEPLWERRAQLNRALLAGAAAIGLEPFAARPSPALAAVRAPLGTPAPAVVQALARRGVVVAGGQDRIEERVLRPSVLGYADRYDVVVLVAALEDALRALGHEVPFGQGVAQTLAALAEEAASDSAAD